MKIKSKLVMFITSLILVFVSIIGAGFSTWIFSSSEDSSKSIGGSVVVDDLSENYAQSYLSFPTYTLYIFAEPNVARQVSEFGETYSGEEIITNITTYNPGVVDKGDEDEISVNYTNSNNENITKRVGYGYFTDSNGNKIYSYKRIDGVHKLTTSIKSITGKPIYETYEYDSTTNKYVAYSTEEYIFSHWIIDYQKASSIYEGYKSGININAPSTDTSYFLDVNEPLSTYDSEENDPGGANDYIIFLYPIYVPTKDCKDIYYNTSTSHSKYYPVDIKAGSMDYEDSTNLIPSGNARMFSRINKDTSSLDDTNEISEEPTGSDYTDTNITKYTYFLNQSYYMLKNVYISESDLNDNYAISFSIGYNSYSISEGSRWINLNDLRDSESPIKTGEVGLYNIYLVVESSQGYNYTSDTEEVAVSRMKSRLPSDVEIFKEFNYTEVDSTSYEDNSYINNGINIHVSNDTTDNEDIYVKYLVVFEKCKVLKLLGGPLAFKPFATVNDATFDYTSSNAIEMYPIDASKYNLSNNNTGFSISKVYVAENVYFPKKKSNNTFSYDVKYNLIDTDNDGVNDARYVTYSGSYTCEVTMPLTYFSILDSSNNLPNAVYTLGSSGTFQMSPNVYYTQTWEKVSTISIDTMTFDFDTNDTLSISDYFSNLSENSFVTYDNISKVNNISVEKEGYYDILAFYVTNEDTNEENLYIVESRKNWTPTYVKILAEDYIDVGDSNLYDSSTGLFNHTYFNSSSPYLLYSASNVTSNVTIGVEIGGTVYNTTYYKSDYPGGSNSVFYGSEIYYGEVSDSGDGSTNVVYDVFSSKSNSFSTSTSKMCSLLDIINNAGSGCYLEDRLTKKIILGLDNTNATDSSKPYYYESNDGRTTWVSEDEVKQLSIDLYKSYIYILHGVSSS